MAKAPESVTLLATELAAEAALLRALPTAFVEDEPPLLELPLLLDDELSELEPEELEPVLEAEPEEVEELPPVMLLRIEPVKLLGCVSQGEHRFEGNLTWGSGGAGEDGTL